MKSCFVIGWNRSRLSKKFPFHFHSGRLLYESTIARKIKFFGLKVENMSWEIIGTCTALVLNTTSKMLWSHYMASLGWGPRTVLQKMQFYVWSVKDTRVRMYVSRRVARHKQSYISQVIYRGSSPYANFITANFITAVFQNFPDI